MTSLLRAFLTGPGESRSVKSAVLGGLICVKVSGADTDGHFAIVEIPTAPDLGPLLHIHRIENEWFYALEGEHEFQVGNDFFRVEPGASIFAPRLIPHTWRNLSHQPGKMLAVVQPAGRMEAFFEEFPHWFLVTGLIQSR